MSDPLPVNAPSSLTPDSVKDIFSYENGALFWKIRPSKNVHIGNMAGAASLRAHVINYRGCTHPRAHVVWLWHYGAWPVGAVRHRNGDHFDDRFENLTDATAPSRLQSNPISGIVMYATATGPRYRVGVQATFSDLETAERALNAARIALRDAAVMPKDTGGL